MPTDRPLVLISGLAAGAFLLAAACFRASGASPPRPPQGGGVDPCAEAYGQIRSLFDSIPTNFREPGRPIEEVARQVEEGRERAERFLASCPSAPGRPEVEYILADLTFISFERTVREGGADGLELSGRALALVADAAAVFPPGSARAADCLALTGHLLKKRSAFQREDSARREDLAGMRKSYRDFLSLRPDFPERSAIHNEIADSHFREGEFALARAHLEGARAADAALRASPSSDEKLFDALTGCGDLEAMEALVHRRLAEYPERLGEKGLSRWDREAMSTWLDLGGFWLGYLRLTQGDGPGAREALLRHVSELDEKEARLRAKGGALGNVATIYRDQRSRDLLEFIDSNLGRRPAMDFDLGELWCTRRRVTLSGSRGKVVLAVFRNPGDARAEPFLRAMEALWRREGPRGLEALTVGFLSGNRPPAEQARAMREDLERLQVGMPAGLDPHEKDPGIFRSLHAIVGSASFLVFDRSGRSAWYLPDPRPLDVAVATRVVERLLAEPPPGE